MQLVARPRRAAGKIPQGVWALGFVSLFMDISSETIHALLPVFLVSVLGTSVAAVGWLEGTAEAIAQVTKVFSGTLSDWLGKRKLLTLAGYGLAALTKPLFALAPSAGWVFAARGLDRVGKDRRWCRSSLVPGLRFRFAGFAANRNRKPGTSYRQRLNTSRYCAPPFEEPPMFRSVRFYSVSSPWPDSEQLLSEKLAAAAFKPCGSYTERSAGFEPPTGSEDAPLARRVAGADLLRLRNQTRVLPMAAVKEALEVRLAEYRQRMQEEPGARTKRKLKEQTRDELLPKALLKSDRTTALFLLNESVLAVGTGSERRAEQFLELLRMALGKLDCEPLTFAKPVEHVLGRVFAGDPPPKFALGREARMRDRAEAKSSVRWSEVDLTHANVRRCVKDGMELTHLAIEFDSALRGVLDAKGSLGKLKLVGLEEAADEAAEGTERPEDPLARLDAELALFGGTLRQLVVGLRQALGS